MFQSHATPQEGGHRSLLRRLLPWRAPLALWAVALLVAQAIGQQLVAGDDPDPLRPNIVFIMADDLGWGDVEFHGGSVSTPHLNRLASQGLELRQHTVAPVCSPTRAGLLTGRCWSRFGITTPTNTLALPPETLTLPRALKAAGYQTCLVGKWHLGSLPRWGPNHFGFDHSYGSLAGGVSPWNHRYKKGAYSITWHRNEELLDEPGHVTDLLTAEAVRWIGAHKTRPFFLYVPFTAVHLPLKEPQEWLARVPPGVAGEVPRHYAACVMHLDDAVGRIVAALEEAGVRDNTLLVFTSDNGGSTAENNDLKYPDDNCPNGRLPGNNRPLRGRKGDVYEGGIRVPTLVNWPGQVKPGKNETPVQIIDWMPTFAALAGFQSAPAVKWDGADLSGLLRGRGQLPPRSLYTAGPRWRSRALRFGDWKLVVHGGGAAQGTGAQGAGGERSELYDVARDPGEQHDLAGTQPERVRQMRLRLDEAARADRDAVVPAP